MAASQEQKVDFLLKKIGYVASKTGIAEDSSLSGTKKAPFGEAIPSPLVVPATNIWSDSSLIPATPPGSTGATVQVYLAGTSGHRMTADSTISGNRTFIAYSTYNDDTTAILGDWVDTSFGSDYIIKVFRGDPNSGGVQLSAAGSGSNDTWFFDYSSGVLNFNGTSVPSGVTSSNIYIVGYRYVGGKGAQPTSGFSTFTSLNVSGIATVGGLLDANGGVTANTLIVEDLTNDRVVIAGTGGELEDSANLTFDGSTLGVTGDATFSGNVSVGGISTFSNLLDVNGRIVGIQTNSVIPFYYDNVSEFPSASTYHGAFAHAHNTGRAYFAHAGWKELVNRESNGLVGTGTEGYNVGVVTVTRLSTGAIGTGINIGVGSITGPAEIIIDPATVGANSGTVRIAGDLQVDGSTVTLDTVVTEVDRLEVGANNNTVGAAITQSGTGDILNLYDGSNEVFSVQDGGRIVATATNNVIPFLYSNYSDLPSAGTYHGAFAHVHSTGSAYYAHAGAWWELVRRESTGVVGTGTDRYNVGFVDATNLDVSGVSTFAGLADFNGNIDVDGYTELDDLNVAGVSTFAGLVDINAGGQADTFKVEDLTDNRVVIVGTGGELEDDANLTFNGSTLSVGVDLDVDGQTDLDILNVAETATFSALVDINANLDVSGISTFTGLIDANGGANIAGGLVVNSAQISDLTDGRVVLAGSSGELEDSANLVFSGTNLTIGTATTVGLDIETRRLNVSGIATFAGNIDANGNIDLNGNLDVDGQTDLDVLNVAELSTFTGNIDANGNLDVDGQTDLDVLNVAEDATFSSTVYFESTVSAASSTGVSGQVLQSTGVGVTWATTPATRTSQTFTAAEDQTTFSFNYSVGLLDVFYNGVKLAPTEFTANNGTSVVLGDVAYAGDIIEFISYNTITAGSGGGGASNLNALSDVSIIGTAALGETLTHNGTSFVNDFTTSLTTTATTQVALLSLDLSVYRSVEYQIQVTEGSKYHTTKILAIHNGTAAVFNEYGTLNIGDSTATFDVDISGSNLRLLVTPASSNSTVFKVKFTAIKV